MRATTLIAAALGITGLTGIATLLAADDPAVKCEPRSAESVSTPPFLIGFIAEVDSYTKKTALKPYVYMYDPKTRQLATDPKTGKLVTFRAAESGVTPLPVNGALCAMSSVAVNRFWNHEVFFTIKIGDWEWKIPIPHAHPHE